MRYNLALNYGPYLMAVPRQLGHSGALDAAAAAVMSAYQDACLQVPVTPCTVIKYSSALRELRISLDDPVRVQSPETLGAVLLLLTFQVRCTLRKE
jgi:hypothetical protein